jgi:3-oxoadipate enol-lactonase
MPSAKINGIDLHYEVRGDGPPVLFLHGLGSSLRDWEDQIRVLKDRYQCIAYDARGHGQSGKPGGRYTPAMHSADAVALLDHLNIRTAAVIGLSMGGMIAFQMAVDAPERLTSMVIINSGPYVPSGTLKERLAILQRLVLFQVMSMRKIGETIGKRLFPEPDQGELRELFAARWAENDKRAYMDATRGLIGWSVMQHVPSIRIPTLVLTGDLDYTPLELKQAFIAKMPNAELVVLAGARHAMNMDRADEVNAALDKFLVKTLQAEMV